jgi:hypothetical protein
MGYLPKVYWYGLVLLGILLVGVVVCVFTPKVEALRAMQRKRAALEAENRQQENGVRRLQEKQARFLGEEGFVERTAHEAGLVRSDEVVYKFTTGSVAGANGRSP